MKNQENILMILKKKKIASDLQPHGGSEHPLRLLLFFYFYFFLSFFLCFKKFINKQ